MRIGYEYGFALPRVRIYLLKAGFEQMQLTDKTRTDLESAILAILKRSTGEDFGRDPERWRAHLASL